MKYIYIFILISFNFSVYSQSIELSGGLTSNKFYDTEDTRPPENGTYSSGSDIFIGIGIHHITISDLKFDITINYEKYGGNIRAYSGGMGGGRTVDAKITKSILSISLYPLNKKLFKQLNINAGITYSKLLHETFSGYSNTSVLFNPSLSTISDLKDLHKSYNSNSYLGLKAGLYYDINITSKILLSPQYSFYLGLFEEVIDFPLTVKSMRHYFGIGIKKKLD